MKPGDRVTDGAGTRGTVIKVEGPFVYVEWEVEKSEAAAEPRAGS